MSVRTFVPSNWAAYPAIVDADIAVLSRIGANFAPHAQATPNLTVVVDPGHLVAAGALIEVGTQISAPISPPATNARIDRVVISNTTGTVSVVAGSEAASPTPPALPAGTSPVAQVLLRPGATAITNDAITDERDFSGIAGGGSGGSGLINVVTFTADGTYTPSPGTTKIVVEVQGGGGSGGGTAATSSTTAAVSTGGSAGAYARALITSGFNGVAVTVGLGGAAPAAGQNPGNAGGASSFGSLVVAPGGTRGNTGPAAAVFLIGAPVVSAVPTGGNLVSAVGAQGSTAFIINATICIGGTGGASFFGGGGSAGGNSAGSAALSPGAGGGGSGSIVSSAARSGGAGANGLVIIYEYA